MLNRALVMFIWISIISSPAFSSPASVEAITQTLRQAVSQKEASALFEWLKNQPFIPFYFAEDGCSARAHEMCKLLEQSGIYSRKIFIHGPLKARVPWIVGDVTWSNHVAALVSVLDDSGATRDQVIDPTVAGEPLSPEDWAARFTVLPCVEVTSKTYLRQNTDKGCRWTKTERYYLFDYQITETFENWRPEDQHVTESYLSAYLPQSNFRKICYLKYKDLPGFPDIQIDQYCWHAMRAR